MRPEPISPSRRADSLTRAAAAAASIPLMRAAEASAESLQEGTRIQRGDQPSAPCTLLRNHAYAVRPPSTSGGARRAHLRVMAQAASGSSLTRHAPHARERQLDGFQVGGFQRHPVPSLQVQENRCSAAPSFYSYPGQHPSLPSYQAPPQLRPSPSMLRGRAVNPKGTRIHAVILHKTPVNTDKWICPNGEEACSSMNGRINRRESPEQGQGLECAEWGRVRGEQWAEWGRD